MNEKPRISVVIPTLNEESSLPALLADLATLLVPHEVIVSDGRSVDGTCEVARVLGASITSGPAGRGIQLRAGAAAARAPLYFFVHADARLGPAAIAELAQLTREPLPHAFAFRLRIDAHGGVYRVIEAGTILRGRLLGMPFGDQGLVVTRAAYDAVGGFPAVPLMEDVSLARALRKSCGLRLLESHISVSPRRWERDGAVRRTLLNLFLLARYFLGGDPRRLAERYRPEGHRE